MIMIRLHRESAKLAILICFVSWCAFHVFAGALFAAEKAPHPFSVDLNVKFADTRLGRISLVKSSLQINGKALKNEELVNILSIDAIPSKDDALYIVATTGTKNGRKGTNNYVVIDLKTGATPTVTTIYPEFEDTTPQYNFAADGAFFLEFEYLDTGLSGRRYNYLNGKVTVEILPSFPIAEKKFEEQQRANITIHPRRDVFFDVGSDPVETVKGMIGSLGGTMTNALTIGPSKYEFLSELPPNYYRFPQTGPAEVVVAEGDSGGVVCKDNRFYVIFDLRGDDTVMPSEPIDTCNGFGPPVISLDDSSVTLQFWSDSELNQVGQIARYHNHHLFTIKYE